MPDIELKDVSEAVKGVHTAFDEYKKTNDERLAQIEAKGSADVVTEEKLAAIDVSITAAQTRLDEYELAQKRQNRVAVDSNGNEIDLDAKAKDWIRPIAKARGIQLPDFDGEALEGYKGAFERYLRKDDRGLSADEFKALSVGSDPDGGYTVTPDMSGQIVTQVYETSPMRAYASVQVIGSDALEGMYDLGEAAASWVGETAARTDTDTPELGAWRIPAHELHAFPKATQKLLDDSEINIEAWLAAKVADKFGRAEATAFCTGTGVSQPRGFLTYASGTTLPGTMERIITGANGAFAAAPDGGDALINALYSLKAQYRANATWFMNRATAKLTRKIKDSDGAYLWSPGIAAGQPATLLGYPMASFEDMADPATDSLSIAVGDMRATYQIVDRIGIRTLRDPYSAKPYVGFYSTKRVGGDVVNFESMKLIEFTA